MPCHRRSCAVCSAYSNSFVNLAIFKPNEERSKVADIIGKEAEELTHLFCVVRALHQAPPPAGQNTAAAATRSAAIRRSLSAALSPALRLLLCQLLHTPEVHWPRAQTRLPSLPLPLPCSLPPA